jgi:hypothetical protein
VSVLRRRQNLDLGTIMFGEGLRRKPFDLRVDIGIGGQQMLDLGRHQVWENARWI